MTNRLLDIIKDNYTLEKGGPSTDVFKKKIGVEKTAELFRTVLFGTK